MRPEDQDRDVEQVGVAEGARREEVGEGEGRGGDGGEGAEMACCSSGEGFKGAGGRAGGGKGQEGGNGEGRERVGDTLRDVSVPCGKTGVDGCAMMMLPRFRTSVVDVRRENTMNHNRRAFGLGRRGARRNVPSGHRATRCRQI